MAQPFLGQIGMFGGTFAPVNYAMCNGQIVPISQNDALFALIGTIYGGDGQTTFGLPDLRGRVAINQGQGPGLSPRTIGEASGSEQITIDTTTMPAHNHLFFCTANVAASGGDKPSSAVVPGTPSLPGSRWFAYNDGTNPPPNSHTLEATSLSMAGGNQPHENIMPILCVTYIIAIAGIFPSRN